MSGKETEGPSPVVMARPVDPLETAQSAADRQYHEQLYQESVSELQAGFERVRELRALDQSVMHHTRAVLIAGRKVRAEYVDWNWKSRPTPAALVELDAILAEALSRHKELGGWDPADDLYCCCCPFVCTTNPCRIVYEATACCAVEQKESPVKRDGG